jgi:hypothetical protein
MLPVVLYGSEPRSVTLRAGSVREQGAEENIWAYEGRGNRGLEKTT